MISKNAFILKRNGKASKKSICANPELIENYEEAVNDKTQVWDCHHRNEKYYTKKDLIKMGLYFDCPPCELIFLTHKEHRQAHKYCAEEAERRRKLSNTMSGDKSHCYGKHLSEETRIKISLGNKGKVFSEESKRKMSEAAKRRPKVHYKVIDGKRIYYY